MRRLGRTTGAMLAGFVLLVFTGSGGAQPMKGMDGMKGGGAQIAQAQPGTATDELRQLREEIKALRKELADLKAGRGGQMPMGPGMMGSMGQMPMGPGMMGQMPMGAQAMGQMPQICGQMMSQMMGPMGGMGGAPQPQK